MPAARDSGAATSRRPSAILQVAGARERLPRRIRGPIAHPILGARQDFVTALERAFGAVADVLFHVAGAERLEPALARAHRELERREVPAGAGRIFGALL